MTEETKKCPFCAESINAEAVVCRFCNRDLVPTEEPKNKKGGLLKGCLIIGGVLIGLIILLAIFITDLPDQNSYSSSNVVEGNEIGSPESSDEEQIEATQEQIPPTQTQVVLKATANSSLPDLEILSHQSYVDGKWYHIVGEVQNNSNYPMEYVKIVATLYDDDGKVVGSDYTYTNLDVIPAGGKAPFQSGTDEWDGVTNYKLQAQGREGSLSRQDLTILSHESYVDGKWLHVRGEVQNIGDTDAEYVKLVITLYDIDGNVVGIDYTYTTLDIVSAGGTSPFNSGTDYWPNFDHYDIQVQGR